MEKKTIIMEKKKQDLIFSEFENEKTENIFSSKFLHFDIDSIVIRGDSTENIWFSNQKLFSADSFSNHCFRSSYNADQCYPKCM